MAESNIELFQQVWRFSVNKDELIIINWVMFKVANNMRGLLFVNRYYNTRNLYINGANPIRDRVMSTPSWPVPYYQRIVKAYPIRCTLAPI